MTLTVLLDTHVVYAVVQDEVENLAPAIGELLERSDVTIVVSVASLWEIEIKHRIGKLGLSSPAHLLPDMIRSFNFSILPIDEFHIFAPVLPELSHRDPFDRLLLSACAADGMKLVTVDRALVDHPLAWR